MSSDIVTINPTTPHLGIAEHRRETTTVRNHSITDQPGRVVTPTAGDDGRPAVVLHSAEIAPRQRGGGARTVPLVSQQVGAKDFLNGITMFGPGAAIPEHIHNCDESVLVIKGFGRRAYRRRRVPGRRWVTTPSSPPGSGTSSITCPKPKNCTSSGPTRR